jgi:hypothetical protein
MGCFVSRLYKAGNVAKSTGNICFLVDDDLFFLLFPYLIYSREYTKEGKRDMRMLFRFHAGR